MIYVTETCCVVDDQGRAANLKSNLARGLPWCEKAPARPGLLAIVGSGPSVRSRLDKLRSWPGEIWAINGAYNYLCNEGIVSHFFGVDPLPGLAEYVQNPRPGSIFYIAATCDPKVLDTLRGEDVRLWFPEQEDKIYPPDAWTVNGGTSALTRAPFMAYLMGWRDITLFGADSSFEERRYCYRDGSYDEDSKAEINAIVVGDEGPFFTEIALTKQVAQLGVMQEQFRGMLKFDCDGLIAAYLRAPMHHLDEHGNLSDAA